MPLYVSDIDALKSSMHEVTGYDEQGDGKTTFFDLIYGEHGKIPYETFIEKVSREAAWIFKPVLLRQRLWEKAGVSCKHIIK